MKKRLTPAARAFLAALRTSFAFLAAHPALLDAAVIVAGIVAVAVGVGMYDRRLGIIVLGALPLAAELVAAVLPRMKR